MSKFGKDTNELATALNGQRIICPHCKRSILIQRGKFVNHGPAGSIFTCPQSGQRPRPAVSK